MITHTTSYVYQSQKEVTAKYMDFNCCIQEMKTTHADVKYHSFHQVMDHNKTPSMCATSLTIIKTSPLEGHRCIKVHYEPLVLPTQLPSDSDESNDEVRNKNTICHQENRAPMMTINSVLKNGQKVRTWLLIYYFHLFLIRSSAIITFVFIIEHNDKLWTIVHCEISM